MSIDVAAHDVSQSQALAGAGGVDEFGLTADMLNPLLEGARARGIADSFELMGQAAVLLDARGLVLHVSSHAAGLIGDDLRIASGHLVGESVETNNRISQMIGAALTDLGAHAGQGPRDAYIRVAGASDSCLRVRAISFADGRNNPFQLLKAIILIDRVSVTGPIAEK